jgi:geranylgeranyl diphosphate synthase, type I
VALPRAFNRFRADIQSELKSILNGRQSPLYDMMRYHLGWVDATGGLSQNHSGKALRPTLCLLACEAAGGDYRRALPAAAALELVHNFSLIHDDVQDDDAERRHRPTVWAIWGKPQAINAGTAMRVLADLALFRLNDAGVSVEKQLRSHRLIDESCLSLIEGQYLDISFEGRSDITVSAYLDMIRKKTGDLISCSMELGASLGSDDTGAQTTLRRFGDSLGLAFQVRDDILGIWGREEDTGKPSFSDIRHKKRSFPVVYGFQQASATLKEELVAIYAQNIIDDKKVSRVVRILEDVGALNEAQRMVDSYHSRALEFLGELPGTSGARGELEELAIFLAERES